MEESSSAGRPTGGSSTITQPNLTESDKTSTSGPEAAPEPGDSSTATIPVTSSPSTSTSSTPATTSVPDTTGSSQTSTTSTNTQDTQTAPATCKDGAQRPCAETQDGMPITFPFGEPAGSCKRGLSVCKENAWGACVGAVAPKAKDSCEPGNDDNCNGKPTDHCSCVAGETAPCGESTGACEPGTMTCQADGTWGECVGAKGPSPERCDGKNIDEDCNGKADLQDPACECINGSIQRCSLGGQGDCTLGLQSCFKGRFSHCRSRFPKLSVEQCGARRDGREAILGPATGDENCDGQVDETNWASPKPTGCSLYMMDKDQDGWGAVGDDFAKTEDAKRSTWGCFCPTKIPAGWRSGRHDTVGKDCGDCIDGGDEVKPERSIEPQETPSRCLESLGSRTPFDYNCSGKEERDPEQSGVFKCEYVEGEGCVATGYWDDAVPASCGVEADYRLPKEHCQPTAAPSKCMGSLLIPFTKARCN